jgi:sodium-coupled monocarboxylate transporter 8/12
MVQRFSSAKTIRQAQTALLLNIPGVFLLISLCCFTGLVVFANYADCDPITYSNITGVTNPNQIVPFFVIDKLSVIPGSAGLFLGSIFCASLSSVSSALNSLSAIIWSDFLKRFSYFNGMNDSQSTLATKVIVIICGVICTADAFLISKLGSNLSQISSTLNGALRSDKNFKIIKFFKTTLFF